MNSGVVSEWRWGRVPESELIWCGLGRDFVVFCRSSGKTHYLNSASENLLVRVLAVPKYLNEIVSEFIEADVDEKPLRQELAAMLEHMEELGLVQRS